MQDVAGQFLVSSSRECHQLGRSPGSSRSFHNHSTLARYTRMTVWLGMTMAGVRTARAQRVRTTESGDRRKAPSHRGRRRWPNDPIRVGSTWGCTAVSRHSSESHRIIHRNDKFILSCAPAAAYCPSVDGTISYCYAAVHAPNGSDPGSMTQSSRPLWFRVYQFRAVDICGLVPNIILCR
jgi:hypothetical protein